MESKVTRPFVLIVGEEEVVDSIPWTCHCGNRGVALSFKGIPAPRIHECQNCQCRIPVSTNHFLNKTSAI